MAQQVIRRSSLARGSAVVLLAMLPARASSQSLEECVRRATLPLTIRPLAAAIADSARAVCGLSNESAELTLAPWWGAAWVNTSRASYASDGAVWLGRGLTVSASGGFTGRWKRMSYALRPVLFWGQNLSYRPSRSVQPAPGDYSDPWYATIDRPYMFGAGGYGRLDPGESFVRAATRWIGAGVSTSGQTWGPARLQPLLLGGNGGGFPHLFIESERPVNVGIGRIGGRYLVGRLAASGIGASGSVGTARLAVAAVGTFMPRGLPGVELGGGRFFHLYDSAEVRDFRTLTLPFSLLLKTARDRVLTGPRQTNQLASFFARIAPPTSPMEIYGEFLRDDHAVSTRDAFVATGHNSAWLLGLTRATASRAVRRSLTVEITNGRFTSIARVLPEAPMYTHSNIREGHTLRGMPLGAPALPGGGGLTIDWRRATERRGWGAAFAVMSLAQNAEGGAYNGQSTGYYMLELTHERRRREATYESVVRVEPGYGDVRSVNFALGLRVRR